MPTFPSTDIYALTDATLSLGRSTLDIVDAMLEAGITIIQYREKNKNSGEMLKECLAIKERTQKAGCFFIVNDHIDIAMLCKADGVHVGQDDLPVAAIRKLMGPDIVIGVSASSMAEAERAIMDGADYLGVGAIFSTDTKKDASLAGLELLQTISSTSPIPVVAIGGINEFTLPEVIKGGAQCVCMVSAITMAPDIPQKVQQLRAIIKQAKDSCEGSNKNTG